MRPRTHYDRAFEWCASIVLIAYGVTELQYLMLVIGVLRAIALYINGRSPKTPFFRQAGAIFGCVVFINLAASEAIALTPAPFLYGLLALGELLSCYRASFDARYGRVTRACPLPT